MEIDPRDYDLAVERAQAAVARAKVTLEREQAEAEVARQEWDGLHPGEEPTALVIREPQIRQAEAEYAAAVADLNVAKLNLERTRLSLPFDGVVVSESVDVGQFVGNGSRLATVYGTDVVEVRVPLDSRELAWFDVPSRRGGTGAIAEVSVGSGGARSVWEGRVTRMEAQVDQMSRMVHVVIEVPRPVRDLDRPPALLPGTFVDVRIFGRTLEEVVAVPATPFTTATGCGCSTTARSRSVRSRWFVQIVNRRCSPRASTKVTWSSSVRSTPSPTA